MKIFDRYLSGAVARMGIDRASLEVVEKIENTHKSMQQTV
jgi:hypothetical protein